MALLPSHIYYIQVVGLLWDRNVSWFGCLLFSRWNTIFIDIQTIPKISLVPAQFSNETSLLYNLCSVHNVQCTVHTDACTCTMPLLTNKIESAELNLMQFLKYGCWLRCTLQTFFPSFRLRQHVRCFRLCKGPHQTWYNLHRQQHLQATL
jgi:hypothetical protein